MPLYLPSFDEIMAVAETRGEDSDAPHLWRGLVGAWPLQEPGGVTAFDASGWGRHGTLTGGYSRTITGKGRCIFTGTGGYISIPISVMQSLPLRWTFSCWVWKTAYNVGTILYNTAAGGQAFARITSSLESYTLDHYPPSGGQLTSTKNNRYTWTHLSVVQAGTEYQRIYLDGSLDIEDTTPETYSGNAITATSIGACDSQYILLPALYHRALTLAEIQQLYADPWAMYRLRPSVFAAAVAEPVLTYRNYILGGGVF